MLRATEVRSPPGSCRWLHLKPLPPLARPHLQVHRMSRHPRHRSLCCRLSPSPPGRQQPVVVQIPLKHSAPVVVSPPVSTSVFNPIGGQGTPAVLPRGLRCGASGQPARGLSVSEGKRRGCSAIVDSPPGSFIHFHISEDVLWNRAILPDSGWVRSDSCDRRCARYAW